MNKIHPTALFRLTVLGPLASREGLERGELKRLILVLSLSKERKPRPRRMLFPARSGPTLRQAQGKCRRLVVRRRDARPQGLP